MSPARRQFMLVTVFALGVAVLLWLFRSILVPFVLAVVIAYVLTPVVGAMTRLGKRRHLPRWVAVLMLYAAILAGLVVFSVSFLPRLADEVGVMMKEVPAAFRHVREEWLPAIAETYEEKISPFWRRQVPDVVSQAEPDKPADESGRQPSIVLRPARDGSYRLELTDLSVEVTREGETTTLAVVSSRAKIPPEPLDLERSLTNALKGLLERGQEHATVLLSVGQEVVLFLIKFTFTFFITLMLSAFILVDSERILSFFESMFPGAYRKDYRDVLAAIDRGLAGVIRGQILVCLVNGTLSGIGFASLGLRYWPVLTAIATVFTLIPIFGTIISSVPAILIGLTDSWTTGLLTLGWITIIHQLEANVLNPKIIGKTARMHPVVIFFALIAGERAAGLLGVLLGVPVASIIQNVFLFFKERVHREDPAPLGPADADGGDPAPGGPS